MSQNEWQRMAGRNAIVGIANVGVADTATGNFDEDFFGAGLKIWEGAKSKRRF